MAFQRRRATGNGRGSALEALAGPEGDVLRDRTKTRARGKKKETFFVPHPSHTLGVETVKKNQKNKQLCYSCKCILNV